MPNYLLELTIVLIALIIGSVSNMLIYRLPRQLPLAYDRSKCTHCQHILGWATLVPILSFLFQNGKCTYCAHKIPSRYLLVEIITVIVFLMLFKTRPIHQLPYELILFSCLHCLFWIDLETQLLPDILTFFLMILGLLQGLYMHTFLNNVLGLFCGGLVLFSIGVIGKWIYKKETMGFGDVKLIAGLGALVGVSDILKISYLSFFVGGVIGLCLIFFRLKSRKEYIPFGPFIIIAFYIVRFIDPFPYVF